MTSMRRAAVHCAGLVGILLAGFEFCATPAHADTLGDELKVLLATHPQLQAAQKAVTSADAAKDEAFSGFLPQVTVSGDYGYEHTDSPARRSSPGSPLSTTRNSATLTVTENLFDGFRDAANIKLADINHRIATSNLANVRQTLLFQGASAYLEVIRAGKLVQLAREDERTIQRQLNLENERVRKGSGIGVDVLLAKSRLQVSKERRVAFEGRLRQAMDTYLKLFGRIADPTKLIDPIPPLDMLPKNANEAIAAALKDNPRLESSAHGIDAAGQRKRAAKADLYPRIDLVTRANHENDVDGVDGQRRDYAVLLEARWDLFTGFRTQSRINQAGIAESISRDDLADVNRQIVEETRLAWDALSTTKERVSLLSNAVTIASEVFTAREKLRQAGKESVINVLDAQQEFNRARINFTEASYDARVAAYRVLLAMGRMSMKDLGLE